MNSDVQLALARLREYGLDAEAFVDAILRGSSPFVELLQRGSTAAEMLVILTDPALKPIFDGATRVYRLNLMAKVYHTAMKGDVRVAARLLGVFSAEDAAAGDTDPRGMSDAELEAELAALEGLRVEGQWSRERSTDFPIRAPSDDSELARVWKPVLRDEDEQEEPCDD